MLQIKAEYPEFAKMINDRAAAFGISRDEAFKTEGRLLAKELMSRTPPFSGKAIKKMLGAQGKELGKDAADIETMSALQVGKRRVAKDISRWLYGYKNAKNANPVAEAIRKGVTPEMIGGDYGKALGGVLQKIRGEDVVRIFSTRGRVYGVDVKKYQPFPSMNTLEDTHAKNRDRRGRGKRKVDDTDSEARNIGRWTFLNALVVNPEIKRMYVEKKQKAVGQAKGGWASAFMLLGGRMSTSRWVGKHAARAGSATATFGEKIFILMVNRSRWASGGDHDRVIEKSLEGRAKSLQANIERELKRIWK